MLKSVASWLASVLKGAATKLVVSGIVAAISVYSAVQWWSYAVGAALSAWRWLMAPSGVARWAVGLLIVCTLLLLIGIALACWDSLTKAKPLDWADVYEEDELYGMRMRWSNFARSIRDIHALCPKCTSECEVVYPQSYPPMSKFRCITCAHTSDEIPGVGMEALRRIEVEIRRRINSGEWKERYNLRLAQQKARRQQQQQQQ